MKKLLVLFGLLLASPSFAADNAVIVTPGTGVTMKSKDIGAGVQAMQPVLSDTGGNALSMPTAGADAVSNTSTGLLAYDRLLGFNGTTWDRLQVDANKFLKMTLPSGAQVDLGSQADAACATDNGTCTAIALIKRGNQTLTAINATAGGAVPVGTNTIGTVGQLPYPVGAVPLTASATGTTAATTATLAGAVGKTTYICSLSVRANATANTNVTDTVTGVISGTLSRALWVPANTAGLGVDEMIYNPCVPASATNTSIAVVSGAPGTGGVVTVNATGYQL